MKRIAVIIGTRPEAIKLCPLVCAFREAGGFDVTVCVTGQHREMVDKILQLFSVVPTADLKLMNHNQGLPELSSRAISAISEWLCVCMPDWVVVQGDTTTAFCGALAAYYLQTPVAHVEAGLRTGNKFAPFPEEINRKLIASLADAHFAPTENGRKNLLAEGIDDNNIFVVGNTVIDALHFALSEIEKQPPEIPELSENILSKRRIVLITGHRRESFGEGFRNICKAIRKLSEKFPDVAFVYPVHLNPNVRNPVYSILSGLRNVHLIEPLGYIEFVFMMKRCTLILTDSGGVQEEAPSLGKPVLIMRNVTERQEGINGGVGSLVGAGVDSIVSGVSMALEQGRSGLAQSGLFGDGKACERIVDEINRMFDIVG